MKIRGFLFFLKWPWDLYTKHQNDRDVCVTQELNIHIYSVLIVLATCLSTKKFYAYEIQCVHNYATHIIFCKLGWCWFCWGSIPWTIPFQICPHSAAYNKLTLGWIDFLINTEIDNRKICQNRKFDFFFLIFFKFFFFFFFFFISNFFSLSFGASLNLLNLGLVASIIPS